MAAVPELPLGQMVFFRLAKVSGGLVLFLFSYFWGCRGKHVDKRKPGKEEIETLRKSLSTFHTKGYL